MLEIVDLFREKGTLDELGFGTIRDAFSDHLFPGTSTIQTRARYFLFVPWIYRRIEGEGVGYSQVEARARRAQAMLVEALKRGGEGPDQGVIGIQAGESLQRTPASIYWVGLKRYGIWRFPGSVAEYYATPGSLIGRPAVSDDNELIDRTPSRGWDPNLPKEPTGFLDKTTLGLNFEEADYLSDRIRLQASNSLLAFCVDSRRPLDRIDFPWLHPDAAHLSHQLRSDLDHARRFSIVSYGGTLLYNLMLAEKAEEAAMSVADGLVDERRRQLQSWAEEASEAVRDWKLDEFWVTVTGKGHDVKPATRQFVQGLAGAIQEGAYTFADHQFARASIKSRELALKGGLARLTHPHALERFTGSVGLGPQSSVGPYGQSYRWPNVQRIVGDIHAGLARKSVR